MALLFIIFNLYVIVSVVLLGVILPTKGLSRGSRVETGILWLRSFQRAVPKKKTASCSSSCLFVLLLFCEGPGITGTGSYQDTNVKRIW